MTQFILNTDRLHLSPFSIKQHASLHQLFTHPFIREFLWDDVIISPQETRKILEQNEQFFNKYSWGLWQLKLEHAAPPIGFVGLWPFFEQPQPQLLYGLLPDYTGQGLATEAAKKILAYAAKQLDFKFLTAATDIPNLASQKVLERIGMKKTEERIESGKATYFFTIDF